MRIIGGKYKHKRFDVPHTFKARPTTDFAKEGLFNILTNVYVDFSEEPTALDLFGGTGSIGLEFLSRGCRKVVSVEKDFKHYQFLTKVARELGDKNWIPIHADVFKFIQRTSEKYDIIFADPPYALDNLADIPPFGVRSRHSCPRWHLDFRAWQGLQLHRCSSFHGPPLVWFRQFQFLFIGKAIETHHSYNHHDHWHLS